MAEWRSKRPIGIDPVYPHERFDDTITDAQRRRNLQPLQESERGVVSPWHDLMPRPSEDEIDVDSIRHPTMQEYYRGAADGGKIKPPFWEEYGLPGSIQPDDPPALRDTRKPANPFPTGVWRKAFGDIWEGIKSDPRVRGYAPGGMIPPGYGDTDVIPAGMSPKQWLAWLEWSKKFRDKGIPENILPGPHSKQDAHRQVIESIMTAQSPNAGPAAPIIGLGRSQGLTRQQLSDNARFRWPKSADQTPQPFSPVKELASMYRPGNVTKLEVERPNPFIQGYNEWFAKNFPSQYPKAEVIPHPSAPMPGRKIPIQETQPNAEVITPRFGKQSEPPPFGADIIEYPPDPTRAAGGRIGYEEGGPVDEQGFIDLPPWPLTPKSTPEMKAYTPSWREKYLEGPLQDFFYRPQSSQSLGTDIGQFDSKNRGTQLPGMYGGIAPASHLAKGISDVITMPATPPQVLAAAPFWVDDLRRFHDTFGNTLDRAIAGKESELGKSRWEDTYKQMGELGLLGMRTPLSRLTPWAGLQGRGFYRPPMESMRPMQSTKDFNYILRASPESQLGDAQRKYEILEQGRNHNPGFSSLRPVGELGVREGGSRGAQVSVEGIKIPPKMNSNFQNEIIAGLENEYPYATHLRGGKFRIGSEVKAKAPPPKDVREGRALPSLKGTETYFEMPSRPLAPMPDDNISGTPLREFLGVPRFPSSRERAVGDLYNQSNKLWPPPSVLRNPPPETPVLRTPPPAPPVPSANDEAWRKAISVYGGEAYIPPRIRELLGRRNGGRIESQALTRPFWDQ